MNPTKESDQPVQSNFDKCTEQKLMKDGSLEIHCKRGLWAVIGKNHEQVKREADHYWRQYLADGEYKDYIHTSQPVPTPIAKAALEAGYRQMFLEEQVRRNQAEAQRDSTLKRVEELEAEQTKLKEICASEADSAMGIFDLFMKVVKERDTLRAENERLRIQHACEIHETNEKLKEDKEMLDWIQKNHFTILACHAPHTFMITSTGRPSGADNDLRCAIRLAIKGSK